MPTPRRRRPATPPRQRGRLRTQRQQGRLIELNLIGVVLAVAGVALSAKHPGFMILAVVGLTLPMVPRTLELIDAHRRASETQRQWRTLQDSGFTATAMACARRRDGGALIGVDAAGARVAFVSGAEVEVVPFAEIRLLAQTRGTVYRFGELGKKRFGLRFVVGPEGGQTREYGLSFPRQVEGMRAFGTLRQALGGAVPVDDSEPV